MFERLDEKIQPPQVQERIDGEVRSRGVVLNGIVVVRMTGANGALEMRAACDERRADFVHARARRAEISRLAGELVENEGVDLRPGGVRASVQMARGRCGSAVGNRQQPQKRDAAELDKEARDGNPQPRPLFHTPSAVTTG